MESLFCPDSVVWGDVGTWIGAAAVALIAFFSYRVAADSHRAQQERDDLGRALAEADAHEGLWHAFVAVDQALTILRPQEPNWSGDVVRARERLDQWSLSSVSTGTLHAANRSRASLQKEDAILLNDAANEMWGLAEACSHEEDTAPVPLSMSEASILMSVARQKLRMALDRFAERTGRPDSAVAERSAIRLSDALAKRPPKTRPS